MTLFKKFIGFTVLVALFFACKKEMSSENPGGSVVVETKWEFKEGETLFQGDIDTAFIAKQPGFTVLTIEGRSNNDNNGVLLVQVGTDSLVPGTYNSADLFFQYSENGNMLYESVTGNPNFAFTLTIDALDSASISGIFEGTVIGNDSLPRTITEGKFSAELTGGSNNGPDTIPDPGPDSIPVDPNADYLPLASVWTYGNITPDQDELFGTDTVKVVSQPEVELDGKMYTPFFNETTGATRYFRKDTAAGLYYEYLQPSDILPLETPVETIILQEDSTPNFTWESPDYTVIYIALGQETRIPVKLKSTITNYNASYEIGGKVYNNVIEVMTELYSKQVDGTYAYTGSFATTYFAKGIGIIAYAEQITGVPYGIRNFTVVP